MKTSLAFLASIVLLNASVLAQAPRLQGAWEVVEVTTSGASPTSRPQTGMYIFTDRYMSVTRETGTATRPSLDAATATADQLRARLQFSAAAGPYDITNDQIVFRRTVALAAPQGTPTVLKFRIVADTLWLTQVSAEGAAIENPETRRLRRLN